jgi:peroxiredoxin
VKGRLLTLALLAIIAGTVGFLFLSPQGMGQAPDITFSTMDGKRVYLKQLRGRPVLVNFWATTCPGCIKEMPHLVELYQDLAPEGFEILAVAMQYDPPEQVRELVASKGLPYPIIHDTEGEISRAFGDVRLTPSNFLISPGGDIVQHKIGDLDMEHLTQSIKRML